MGTSKVVSRKNDVLSNNVYSDINNVLEIFSSLSNNKESNSIISKAFNQISRTSPETSSIWMNNFYSAIFNSVNGDQISSNIAAIPTNKSARLQEYERMARNAEVDACLDEIADSSINFNEKKQCIEIVFNDLEYDESPNPHGESSEKSKIEVEDERKREVIYKEFYKFIYPLKLKGKFHRYMKSFLKTGECCWENVINKDDPSMGIIDFNYLPAYSYDFAYDKETRERIGIWVKVLKTRVGSSLNYDVDPTTSGNFASYTSSATGRQYTLSGCNRFDDYSNGDLLFLPFDQVTYVESGEHSPDDLIVYPLIEKARRAFNQLMCIEDAIIIYRLARAPTRLVFNVGVGMANNSKGAQQVQQLIRRYNVAKSYNPSTGTTTNVRDPHTMTESFWFMKSANGEGTDVTELSSSVNMGDLVDLEYFQKKLWTALHVPSKRFTDGGEILNKNPANEMTADEYKFCKFIIRILLNFSDAIKDSFVTHLKLTGLYETLEINESYFDIHFVNPLSYELYEQGRVLQQRIEMYKAVTEDADTFAKTIAMKKYLNWTDDDVEENWRELETQKIRLKIIENHADAVAEDEIEAFKLRIAAERAAKKAEEEEQKKHEYDSTKDIIDAATSTKMSDQVAEKGVQAMANSAQGGDKQKQGGIQSSGGDDVFSLGGGSDSDELSSGGQDNGSPDFSTDEPNEEDNGLKMSDIAIEDDDNPSQKQ